MGAAPEPNLASVDVEVVAANDDCALGWRNHAEKGFTIADDVTEYERPALSPGAACMKIGVANRDDRRPERAAFLNERANMSIEKIPGDEVRLSISIYSPRICDYCVVTSYFSVVIRCWHNWILSNGQYRFLTFTSDPSRIIRNTIQIL